MAETDSTRLTLLLRLRDGANQLSWQEFHERYGHLLYCYARSRGAAHADAEDIVQEVELAVFKALAGFEYDARKGRFRAYLRAAVFHALARRATQAASKPATVDPRHFDGVAGQREAAADEVWEREWELNRLRQAVLAIAPEFDVTTMKAFEMSVLAGVPVVTVAAQLSVSKWVVYRARDRVLARLKERLAGGDGEEP